MRAKDFLIDDIQLDESPAQVRASIIQKVNKIADEPDLMNILQYANQYAFKKDVGKLSDVKGYKENVSNIILQAIGKVQAPVTKVRAFLKQLATEGIIKEDLLLTPGAVHSMDQIVDTAYLPMFKAIQLDLFEKISGKMGEKGDVGKGEYLLSVLSPRIIRRGAPGDISIADVKVELKAGQSGRLGPAGSQALAGRFEEFLAACVNAKLITPEASQTVVTNPVAFNPSLNMSGFSQFFGNNTAKALSIMLKMHYPSVNTDAIASACVKGNAIDGTALKAKMLSASYFVYQKAKEFDGILLTDYGINKYLYIYTPDSAAAAAPFLTVKFPSWTDTQSNTIKITLKGRA
jgi:hypothetical protein